MLLLGKVSFVLSVLCSILCIHQVKGNEQPCKEQHKDILQTCYEILTRGSMRMIILPKHSPCCRKVREVPHNDMCCIIKLLTVQEHMDYVETRIKNLEHYC
ncbi:hypothetical protein GQ55_3G405800 [Panicum hallii var. hallii]|uniref:Bifunctional inhibitor/plant lipid transfer protein/seed storage helical domain-containing protein n=1 Tax=Panicum hallii var. hallii TaxID=1504633 RepID=A0A2T7EH02_9POAL|nr:hypothetical protein GQ55_3G405800 [Panicum hallii var. hallii]